MEKAVTPKSKEINTSVHDKGFYYFKDVKMDTSGFTFDEITEITVEDGFPQTAKMIVKDHRMVAINDFFAITMNNNKDIATIVLRMNMKCTSTLFPKPVEHPVIIPREEFEEEENKGDLLNFYKFCKLTEMEMVRLRFAMPMQKIVLNEDQIIFIQPEKVIIYTPFALNEISVTALDVCVSRYLYILTVDSILVYGDKLIKTIKLDKIYRFIVPTPLHIFIIANGSILKVTDDRIEPYFDLSAKIIDYCFDDEFMYCTTANMLYKISFYDPQLVTAIKTDITVAKVSLCNNYIVLYSCHSGIVYVDKNDFSRFCKRNLDIGLCSVASHGDTIAYLCVKSLFICKYVSTPTGLHIVEQQSMVPMCISHPKLIFVEDVIDAVTEYSYKYEATSNHIQQNDASNNCTLTPNHDIGTPSKSTHDNNFMASNNGQDDSIQLQDSTLDNCHASHPYKFYGLSAFVKRSDRFSHLLAYKTAPEALEATNTYLSEMTTANILCSPPATASQYTNTYDSLFSNDEKFVEPVNQKAKPVCAVSKRQQDIVCREMKQICKLIQRQTYALDEFSSDSDDELFFEAFNNHDLSKVSHPVLRSIPRTLKPKRQRKTNGKIRMYNVFKKVMSTTGISHSLTTTMPFKMLRSGKADVVVFRELPKVYTSSTFFVENYIDFFKKRFTPRDRTEKPYKGVMYAFVNEELKRISSYKDESPIKTSQKVELPKNKRGGF